MDDLTRPEAEAIVWEACLAANPKLKELSFGCGALVRWLGGTNERVSLVSKAKIGAWLCVNERIRHHFFEQEMEIVGHPVTLPDVLLALGERGVVYALLRCHDHPHLVNLAVFSRKTAQLDLRTGLSGWGDAEVIALAELLTK